MLEAQEAIHFTVIQSEEKLSKTFNCLQLNN